MNTNEIRRSFLEYFSYRGHTVVQSSSLIPSNDPTLLFTNAGMVQFKDVFLGHEQRNYKRAASSQYCLRAGGKHNDLDNVGYTARHHTLFEMLGNFSFGDYFKKEAIDYAWDFLTNILKIPKERLWITVHYTDKEAEDIWLNEIGVNPERFSRCGDDENFWSMGETGPCGPCTEIFYDHGEKIAGGPPGSPDAEGDRYVEIWNLVFMQFNRAADGSMTALPKPSVDTGMGLERIAAVMQGVHSNYDIDIFKALINEIAKIAKTNNLQNPSLKVIADHIRSTCYLIMYGVRPSNEGRGYVLRRIIRRALRHGYMLGISESFFYKLVGPLVELMKQDWKELEVKDKVFETGVKLIVGSASVSTGLKQNQKLIEDVIEKEEQQFARTLSQGMKLFQQAVKDPDVKKSKTISGDVVFKLYDTYGFPVDLCADMAREHNLTLDTNGFEACMQQQRTQSQANSHFVMAERLDLSSFPATEFTGYAQLHEKATVQALLKDGELVTQLGNGEKGMIILERTPFYPEGGGQVGDVGIFKNITTNFKVTNTTKQDNVILHQGEVNQGEVSVGMELEVEVDCVTRQATRLNHSATHLLHAALREILGNHVVQKGSLVGPEYLRFDFAHFAPVTPAEIAALEQRVNQQIRENSIVHAELLEKEQALERGAMALFEEKYGDEVRVLTMGDGFSVELCGGTHVVRTGDIGAFKITGETGIAAGVRRIEAVTGKGAFNYIQNQDLQLRELAALLKSPREQVGTKLQQILDQNRALEKEIAVWQGKFARQAIESLVSDAIEINGVKVLSVRVDAVNRAGLRDAVEHLLSKLGHAVVCLATVEQDQIGVLVGVSKELTSKIPANGLVQYVSQQVGGKGGGRPDMAQGGGTDVGALNNALHSVIDWVKEKIK